MKSKSISVVTGGNGFVGSHLVDLLLEKNHSVKCIVRKSSNLRWLEGKPVEIIKSGLFDKEKLNEVLKDADYLYHIAGVVKAKNKEGYYRGNVDTTKNLLDVLLDVNRNIEKVVVVTSLTVCGPTKINNPSTEQTIPQPITTYGKSKLAQEELTKEYMDKLPITIVRAPAVFGERDTEIYLMFKTYQSGLMTLIGFNKKQLSLVYVKDLVEGIYLAGISNNSSGQIYFISAEELFTWPEVGKVISKVMNKKAITIRLPHFLVYTVAVFAQFFAMFSSKPATFNIEKAKDFVQEAWTCDIRKAKKELGFTPKYSLDDAISNTINWYKKHKWLS